LFIVGIKTISIIKIKKIANFKHREILRVSFIVYVIITKIKIFNFKSF
jgi:hypothetical protein